MISETGSFILIVDNFGMYQEEVCAVQHAQSCSCCFEVFFEFRPECLNLNPAPLAAVRSYGCIQMLDEEWGARELGVSQPHENFIVGSCC